MGSVSSNAAEGEKRGFGLDRPECISESRPLRAKNTDNSNGSAGAIALVVLLTLLLYALIGWKACSADAVIVAVLDSSVPRNTYQVPTDMVIGWINFASHATVDPAVPGNCYVYNTLTIGNTSSSDGVIGRAAASANQGVGTSVGPIGVSHFMGNLTIPVASGTVIRQWPVGGGAILSHTAVCIIGLFDPAAVKIRKSGHVAQIRIQDPGASSGEGSVSIDTKALGSRVLTAEKARQIAVEMANAMLVAASFFVENSYLFSDIEFIREIQAPMLTGNELLRLLNDWTFAPDGFAQVDKSITAYGRAFQKLSGLDFRDVSISAYVQALLLLDQSLLPQDSPRVWLTSHHRKRIE